MTLFGLVRHGQTDYNQHDLFQGSSDIPLNAAGRAQAHHALDHGAAVDWNLVVSSPLVRARETARIVAEDHGIALGDTEVRLREIDWGTAEGKSVSEMESHYPERDFPGREDPQQVADRGYAALTALTARYPAENVLIVAHGTLIRLLLTGIVARNLPSVPNGTLSLVEVEGSTWTVRMLAGKDVQAQRRADGADGVPRFSVDTSHLRAEGPGVAGI